jgi:hypothetical protein
MTNLTAKTVTVSIIGVVVLFSLGAALYPTLSDAGSDLNESGIGLGSIFAGTLLGVIVGAGLLFAFLKAFGFM